MSKKTGNDPDTNTQTPDTNTQTPATQDPDSTSSSNDDGGIAGDIDGDPSDSIDPDNSGIAGELDEDDSSKTEDDSEPYEEFDVEFSEETPLSEDQRNSLQEKVKVFKLSKEQAAELISEVEAIYNSGSSSVADDIMAKVKADREAVANSEYFKTDDARKESLAKIKTVVEKFGDDSVKAFFKSSKSNDLSLMKMIFKIAEAMDPASETPPKGSGQAGDAPKKTLAEQWYPGFFEEK